MTVQPFTPAGVAAKQTELYALSDHDLQAEADKMKADFLDYMNTNFTFTTSQGIYLSGLPAKFKTTLGFQLGAIVSGKGVITMAAVPTNDDNRPKQLKVEFGGDMEYVDGPFTDYTFATTADITWELIED